MDGLRRLNRLRREASSPSERDAVDAAADALLDDPSTRLAVYGSLAPGEVNDHVLADLDGRWRDGFVRGVLRERGWGADHGFPGLIWKPGADRVDVRVFASDELPEQWERLDRFEGSAYERALVPVEGPDGEVWVCNAYLIAGTAGPDA